MSQKRQQAEPIFLNNSNQLPYLYIHNTAQLLQPIISHWNLRMLPEREAIQIFQVITDLIRH